MGARNFLCGLAAAVLAGCASYGAGLTPGQSSLTDVETIMGQPTAVTEEPGGGQTLWYSKLPYGRENYAARIDPRGTLVALEQTLTPQNIAKIRPNVSTTADLMEILGPPYRQFKFPLKDRVAWEYPLRTSPELQTLFVEVTPDFIVRDVYALHDRDRCGFSIGGIC
ncbi:MAG: hypothetical protein JO035_01090 [Betaproteobacteria bacterium]|nr:hypothetical protein [Betaproteobacteria bacterium]